MTRRVASLVLSFALTAAGQRAGRDRVSVGILDLASDTTGYGGLSSRSRRVQ